LIIEDVFYSLRIGDLPGFDEIAGLSRALSVVPDDFDAEAFARRIGSPEHRRAAAELDSPPDEGEMLRREAELHVRKQTFNARASDTAGAAADAASSAQWFEQAGAIVFDHRGPRIAELRHAVHGRFGAPCACVGDQLYPPGGYRGWHTNFWDVEGWVMFLVDVDTPRCSFFRFAHPETRELVTVWDEPGRVNVLRATRSRPLWHGVRSQHAYRFSQGFMLPDNWRSILASPRRPAAPAPRSRTAPISASRPARRPDDAASWSNLGTALRARRRHAAAVACHRRAVELEPGDSRFWNNLGNALKDAGELDEAISALQRAVSLGPHTTWARHNLAVALREAGRTEEAIAVLDDCLADEPDSAAVQWDRALALLEAGRMAEGWEAYRVRRRLEKLRPPPCDAPDWAGEDVSGQSVLLYPEQGFGDQILASRFVPLVARRGARVTLQCEPALWRLFEALEGVSDRIPPGRTPSRFDWRCSLLDLPGIFGAAPGRLPPLPRLHVPESSRRRAHELLRGGAGRFRVGICWSGSVTFEANWRRAVRPEPFIRLAGVSGVQLYSLYKGPLEHQLQDSGADAVILDVTSSARDFADTAAVIEQLDLVIMTDSAVAHLTGSLGRPVWVLLDTASSWLWGRSQDETFWYPSMRLFRQRTPGAWGEPFAQVERALGEVVREAAASRTRQAASDAEPS
jgi:hypothetical protein